jgi:hypothetical protein
MALVRGHHSFDAHFTQIPNSWARDNRLTLKARGVLLLVMSHQPGWNLTIRTLAQQQKISRDALSAAVQELESLGYLKRSQDNPGRFGEAVWTTCDPDWSEKPMTENPMTEKPATKNNNIKKTITKELFAQEFEEFWQAYPRKVGKVQAMRAFLKATEQTPAEWVIEGARRFGGDPNQPPVQFIPYPATWLNRGGWEDGPLPERIKTPEELRAEAEVRLKIDGEKRAQRIAEETRLALEEEARLREQSAPAPRCPHGENVALCLRCL